MESLQSFFTQLFTELTNEDSIAILFFLFISFLIGLIFGRFSVAGKYRRAKKALRQKESELIALQAEHNVLLEQFEENEASLEKVELENKDYKIKNAQLESEKIEFQGYVYASADVIEKLTKDNLSNLTQIEELNSKITILQTSNTNLNSEVERDVEVINDITQIRSSYNETINRLSALEAKLNNIEKENLGLRTELTNLKDNSSIAFVDVNLDENDEPEETKEEKALKAKKAVKSVLGNKIPVAKAKDKNDLTAIKGVGPFIEGKLNDIGIYTYEQIGKFDKDFIQLVTDAIQFFPGRIKRDNWVGQAKKLHKKG
jgi:predicted flap endonuclease-1-like 5' DNA nuclease